MSKSGIKNIVNSPPLASEDVVQNDSLALKTPLQKSAKKFASSLRRSPFKTPLPKSPIRERASVDILTPIASVDLPVEGLLLPQEETIEARKEEIIEAMTWGKKIIELFSEIPAACSEEGWLAKFGDGFEFICKLVGIGSQRKVFIFPQVQDSDENIGYSNQHFFAVAASGLVAKKEGDEVSVCKKDVCKCLYESYKRAWEIESSRAPISGNNVTPNSIFQSESIISSAGFRSPDEFSFLKASQIVSPFESSGSLVGANTYQNVYTTPFTLPTQKNTPNASLDESDEFGDLMVSRMDSSGDDVEGDCTTPSALNRTQNEEYEISEAEKRLGYDIISKFCSIPQAYKEEGWIYEFGESEKVSVKVITGKDEFYIGFLIQDSKQRLNNNPDFGVGIVKKGIGFFDVEEEMNIGRYSKILNSYQKNIDRELNNIWKVTVEETAPPTSVAPTLYQPLVTNTNSVWYDAQDTRGEDGRANKFKIIGGVYNKTLIEGAEVSCDPRFPKIQNNVEDTFVNILISTAAAMDPPLNKAQVEEIIKFSKKRGGVTNSVDGQKKYLSKDESEKTLDLNAEIGSEDAKVSLAIAKRFSAKFQSQCKACGILSGRDGTHGLRLTFLPETVNKLLKDEDFQNREMAGKANKNLENIRRDVKACEINGVGIVYS